MNLFPEESPATVPTHTGQPCANWLRDVSQLIRRFFLSGDIGKFFPFNQSRVSKNYSWFMNFALCRGFCRLEPTMLQLLKGRCPDDDGRLDHLVLTALEKRRYDYLSDEERVQVREWQR